MSSLLTAKLEVDDYHPQLKTGRAALAIIGVLWSSLQTLIPTISSAVVFFISAAFLSPADFGMVGLASSLVMTVIAFTPMAFGEALVQRKSLTKAHADSVFWLTMGFGVMCFLPFAIWAKPVASLMGDVSIAAILPVLALRLPLDLAAAVPNAMIVRSMRFKLIALRTAIATMISVTICLVMLFAGYGYWALVVSQVAASFVACAMAYWVARWQPGSSFRISALRDLFSYGLFASGNRMLATIKVDHMLLGVLAGTTTLGLFFFAQRLYNMLTQLVGGALSSVTLALLSTLQGDLAKTTHAFGMASFFSAAVSMPMFCALAITGPEFLALLLDNKWADAAFPVQAFCVLGVLAGIGVVQAALIKSQGKTHWWFYYQLIQQCTTILAILLTYSFGLKVLMIALVIKSILIWPLSVLMTVKLLECSVWQYLSRFKHPVAATLAMSIGMLAVPHMLTNISQVAGLILQLIIGAAIYVPFIFILSRDRLIESRRYLPAKGKLT